MKEKVIDVKTFVTHLRENVRDSVIKLSQENQIKPTLAVVLVGNDSASEVYVKQKIKACKFCHIESVEHYLDKDTPENNLIQLIESLNRNDEINGILVQLPLPKQMDETKVINSIHPLKDVDGFHLENIGRLHSQQNQFIPCTPLGVSMMLEHYFGDISGKSAVIIGRSRIVGRPMAELLLQKNCTVTTVHSRTPKKVMNKQTKNADIIVAAVGSAGFLKGKNIKKGAIVVDVGINRIYFENGESKIVGDVDFESALDVVSAITPVPGGVGLLTVSCLMANTLKATCLQHSVFHL